LRCIKSHLTLYPMHASGRVGFQPAAKEVPAASADDCTRNGDGAELSQKPSRLAVCRVC
jgi:hypothetical protein